MKSKRILALVVSLAMVLAIVPSFAITASAAGEEVVLFDIADVEVPTEVVDVPAEDEEGDEPAESATEIKIVHGDIALQGGVSSADAGVVFSNQWSENGTWNEAPWGATGLMFFRANGRGNGSDETKTAAFDNAADTKLATKVAVEFNYAAQVANNNYQTWEFVDNDGDIFARLYVDIGQDSKDGKNNAHVEVGTDAGKKNYIESTPTSREDVIAFLGANVKIEAVPGEAGWTVTYTIDGEEAHTETVASVNGIASIRSRIAQWNDQYAAMALQGLKVTYVAPESIVSGTVTYKAGEDVVEVKEFEYDPTKADGYELPEKDYRAIGSTTLYHADATTVKESTTIEMTALDNADVLGGAKEIETADARYTVASGNLIPNGDFAHGLAGWYNGLNKPAEKFVVNDNGTINTTDNKGGATETAFWGSFEVEPGTYAFHVYFDADTTKATDTLFVAATADTRTEEDGSVIVGVTNSGATHGTNGDGFPAGESNTVFEVTADKPVVHMWFRWHGPENAFGKIGLYKVEKAVEATPTKVTVKAGDVEFTAYEGFVFEGEEVAKIAEKTFAVGGKLYMVEAQEVKLTVDAPEATVDAVVVKDYVAKSVATTTGNETRWPDKIGDAGFKTTVGGGNLNIADDDDQLIATGNYAQYGSERRLTATFDAPEVADGQIAVLHLAIGAIRQNHGGGSATFRMQVNANGKAAYTTSMTDSSNGAAIAPAYITADITELVRANAGDEIAIELVSMGAFGVIDEVQSGWNGVAEGVASYIEIVENPVTVTVKDDINATKITKNGSAVEAPVLAVAGDVIRVYTDEEIAAVTGAGKYAGVVGGVAAYTVPETEEVEIEAVTDTSLNVTVIDAAQVRVGDADGKSGLRFIATVAYEGGLEESLNDEDSDIEIGIAVSAEGSDKVAYIPAVKFQNDDKTVFTAVLTDIKDTNLNRVFMAQPYVKIGDAATLYGEAEIVKRSVYQVSAGILLGAGDKTSTGTDVDGYELDDAVADVLNAYVNKVGIRLTFAGDKFAAADTYTGDVLFSVTEKDNGDGTFVVTVTPTAEKFVIDKDAVMASIRVNNNNSKMAEHITGVEVVDNVLTFTFSKAAIEAPAEG